MEFSYDVTGFDRREAIDKVITEKGIKITVKFCKDWKKFCISFQKNFLGKNKSHEIKNLTYLEIKTFTFHYHYQHKNRRA